MKVLFVLLAMVILTSCSHELVLMNNSDAESGYLPIKTKYVRLGEGDFFVQEGILNYATPDFLDEEQKQVYLRALSLYPIFNGSPMLIADYPLQDGSYPASDKMGTEAIEIDGVAYFRVFGRYAKWSDFQNMMLSVFTEEYFPIISNNCIEHNGDTYILDSAAGTPFYSNMENAPDTFELVSKNDSEIVFFRYQYFFETGNENPIFKNKYDIVMKKIDETWYVDLFEKDCEIAIE